MYLKRLELQGFKSFAPRTRFEFDPGITAIVGPNGSGKSNIADALRWVLGEHSGQLIRAKKAEEVIFAGSSTRSRSDKAEVTIILDNSEGSFPVDADEIAIRRRANRSGDSTYYVNDKRVRLRDLQTLMQKSSVTQNSYAIIGQGLVESVLNLKAEDRRPLIEEAADTQRYRLKIDEAEDRLKATHENVGRIQLLIKEIAPRLEQMERQAQKAGDYERISTELTQALRVYYEQHWHHAQESLIVATASHDQAQAEFTQAKVGLETCQREQDEISKQIEEYRSKVAAVSADRERAEQHIGELERRLAVSRERSEILTARHQELREELTNLEEDRDRSKRLIESYEDERKNAADALKKRQKEFEAVQAKMSSLRDETRETQTHAGDAEDKGKRLRAAANEIKTRIHKLGDSKRAVEVELSNLDVTRRSFVTQMSEQLRVLRSLRDQESMLTNAVSETGERRKALESELREVRASLAKVEAAQGARRGKLEALDTRLSVMQEAQKHAQSPDEEGAITVEGALTSLFEVIRVPRGLEDAIAAALADQLETFVFERQQDAIGAIQDIVSQGGPRTFALSIDRLKPVYPLNLMKEKGILGVASRLIKYSPNYEKVVNSLLGRTIIVEGTEVAARVVRRGLGTVVTVDGVVFHPSGIVSGGRPRSSKPFVLGYERDIEAIPKEAARIQKSLDAAEQDAEALHTRLEEADSTLAALTQEAEASLGRRLALQDSLGQRQQKLSQLRGELRGLITAQKGLRSQAEDLERAEARLNEEREATLTEADEADQTAQHLDRASNVFTGRRSEIDESIEQAATVVAKADAEYRSLSVQRENAESGFSRIEEQTSSKRVQLKVLAKELQSLSTSLSADEPDLAAARSELEKLIDDTQPADGGTNHLEARERDLHSQVLSEQKRLFDAERQVLETEAELRRWRTEVETIGRRMAEDGLSLSAEGEVREADTAKVEAPDWLVADDVDDGSSGLRPISGGADVDPNALEPQIERLRSQLKRIGPVNVEAQADYESLRERHDFLSGQVEDLKGAEESLRRAIKELTELMRKRFEETFAKVATGFEEYFHAFFGGGKAKLTLADPKHPNQSGVEIEARPPGKRTKSLTQLSGGEKALTAVSFLFALLQSNPSPYCVMDEVDAMLDEANVERFTSALKKLAEKTQFIVVTHNRGTIEISDSIYGISMAKDGASRVLSMRLGDVTSSA
ncbi:MAG: chromosome segregation protein SMC [Chloroflexi bacterium]|nr:chromosome segregation protein SMC [Chloroflexota bacterium]